MSHISYAASAAAGGELVGTAVLDTIGLVIAGPDPALRAEMKLPKGMGSALGLISSRTGAAGQIVACDDAVKATAARIVSVELPRDTKGWGGHGCYLVLASDTPSDAREAVARTLSGIERNAGEVYISDAGHLEFAYTARAGEVVNRAFGAPINAAFGFLAASPAAIGLVLADRALKAAPVQIVSYMTPALGTSHSNEVILAFSGEASAVHDAVCAARDVGIPLLRAMGSEPRSPGGAPYL
ncbi:MAG: propanediol utilization microcompartment protein PduB [Clostridia bacterium]|nr:propanediol utilization microcompartment protein PduB [Clostridia bacterium]